MCIITSLDAQRAQIAGQMLEARIMPHDVEIIFDVEAFTRAIDALAPAALESFLRQFDGNIESLPFDIFIRECVPAAGTDGTDQIIVGLRLRAYGELIANA